jgi:hypothetical protein
MEAEIHEACNVEGNKRIELVMRVSQENQGILV